MSTVEVNVIAEPHGEVQALNQGQENEGDNCENDIFKKLRSLLTSDFFDIILKVIVISIA
jgi:hypothetical protein